MAEQKLTIQLEAQNEVESELKKTRRQITDLNEQIAKNNAESVKGTKEQRQAINEKNRALRAEKGLLTVQSQRLSLQRKGLISEVRSIREGITSTNALTASFKGLGTAIGAIGVGILVKEVVQFGAASLEAAGKYNNLIRGLEHTEGSAAAAARRFDELNEKAKLPSLDRNTLIQYNNSLSALGATTQQIDDIYEGLSKGVSTFGGSMYDVNGILLQFTQAAGKGKATLQDFKPIIERMPTFLIMANEALGTGEKSWDAFKTAVDDSVASGKSFFETMDPVFKQMQNLPGASVDNYTNLMGNLGDAFSNLQAEIGNRLLPTFKEWGSGLLDLIEKTTDFIRGQQDAKDAIQSLSDAMSNNATIQQKVNAIQGAKDALEAFIEANEDAQLTIPNTGKKAGATAGQLTQLGKEVESAKIQTQLLNALLTGSPDAYRRVINEVDFLKSSTEHYGNEVTRLKGLLEELSPNNKAQAGQYRQVKADLDAAETSHKNYSTQLSAMQGALEAVTERNRQAALGTADLKTEVIDVDTSTRAFIATTKALIPELTLVETGFDAIAPTAERVKKIFDDLKVSVVDNQAETRALNLIYTELHGGLTAVAAETETFAHNAKLVNPAVSNAILSIDSYSNSLTHVITEYTELESIQQDVITGSRDAASAFADLRKDTDAAEISLDDIDDTMDAIDDTIQDDLLSSIKELAEEFGGLGKVVALNLNSAVDLIGQFDTGLGNALDSLLDLFDSAAKGDVIGTFAKLPGLVKALNATSDFSDSPFAEGGVLDQADAIIKMIEGTDISRGQKANLIQPIQEYIEEVLVRSILSAPDAFAPALIAKTTAQAREYGIDFDFESSRKKFGLGETPFGTPFEDVAYDLAGVVTEIQAIQRELTRTPKQRREAADTTDTVGTGAGEGESTNITRYTPVTETGGPGMRFNATLGVWEQIPTPGSETGAPVGSQDPTAPLEDPQEKAGTADVSKQQSAAADTPPGSEAARHFHSFTPRQRSILESLENVIDAAETTFESLEEGISLNELLDAYDRWTAANKALYDQQIAYIDKDTNLTGVARENAETDALTALQSRQERINRALGSGAGLAGRELVSSLGSEAWGRGDILFRGVAPDTPQQTHSEKTYKTVTGETQKETKKVDEAAKDTLKTTHRFTDAQDTLFGTIETGLTDLERIFRTLDDDSSWQEITSAYLNWANAEKYLHDQRMAAIDEAEKTGQFTAKAISDARTAETQRFKRTGWGLNDLLTSMLGGAGYGLTSPFGATEGLRYTLGDLNLREVQPEPRTDRVAKAETDDTVYKTVTGETVEPEKETVEPEKETVLKHFHSFTAEQRSFLKSLSLDIDDAKTVFTDLKDGISLNELLTAYENWSTANKELYDQQIAYIDADTSLTEQARENAERAALGDYNTRQGRINRALGSGAGLAGRELVSDLGNEPWARGDILFRGVAPDTPQQTHAADPVYKTVTGETVTQQTTTTKGGIPVDEPEPVTETPTETAPETPQPTYRDLGAFTTETQRQQGMAAFMTAVGAEDVTAQALMSVARRELIPIFRQEYLGMREEHFEDFGKSPESLAAFEERYGKPEAWIGGQIQALVERYAPDTPVAEEIADTLAHNPLLDAVDNLADKLEDNSDRLAENRESIQRQLEFRKQDIRESFAEQRTDRRRTFGRSLADTFSGIGIFSGDTQIGTQELQSRIHAQISQGFRDPHYIMQALGLGFSGRQRVGAIAARDQTTQQAGEEQLFGMIQGLLRQEEDAGIAEARAIEDAEQEAARAEMTAELQAQKTASSLAEAFGDSLVDNTGEGGPIVSAIDRVVAAIGGIDFLQAPALIANVEAATADPLAAAASGDGGGDSGAMFHSMRHDNLAELATRDIFASNPVAQKNARDLGGSVARGVKNALAASQGGFGGNANTINLEIVNTIPFYDGEVRRVTKRQVELDQQQTNYRMVNTG